MNQELINILLLIGVGYLFKKLKILKESDGEVISRIIFNITLPALVIVSLNSVQIEPSLMLLPIIVVSYGLLSVLLAYFVFKDEEKELKGTMMMLSTGYNVGLFAFPLVEAFWGAEGLLYFGMFDAGNAFLVFGVSYILGSYYSKDGLSLNPIGIVKKFSKSIPFMSYIIMTIFNFVNIKLPTEFIDVATIISKANMPLSLILLGVYMNFTFEKQYGRPIFKYLVFRYGFGLVFGLAFYFLLPVSHMFKLTILIGFLLPIGLAVIPYSHEFKYSTARVIGTISNICILISIVILFLLANFVL
jgi:malate permease and related proteins